MHLQQIRQKIDTIDTQIARLIGERIDWALCTSPHKTAALDPGREQAIISRLTRSHAALIPEKTLAGIYGELFSLSRELQSEHRQPPLFLGGHGGFAEEICQKFQPGRRLVAIRTLQEFCTLLTVTPDREGILTLDNLSRRSLDLLWEKLNQARLHIRSILTAPAEKGAIMITRQTDHRALREIWTTPFIYHLHQSRFRRLDLRPRLFSCESLAAWKVISEDHRQVAVAGSMACAGPYDLEIITELDPPMQAPESLFLQLSAQEPLDKGKGRHFVWSRTPQPACSGSVFWQSRFPGPHQIILSDKAISQPMQAAISFSDCRQERSP